MFGPNVGIGLKPIRY